MNNNKGINLLALIITIIVMILLAGIGIRNSLDAHNNSFVARAKEENRHVVDAVEHRYGSYMVNPTAYPLLGVALPDDCDTIEKQKDFIVHHLRQNGVLMIDDEESTQTISEIKKLLEENEVNKEYTRILDHSNLSELGLEGIPTGYMFVVNYYGLNVIGPIN